MYKSRIFFLISFLLPALLSLQSQDQRPNKIAILPFTNNGIDDVSSQTAESILRLELEKLTPAELVSQNKTYELVKDSPCSEVECALEAAEKLGANKAVGLSLSVLGSKIIVQYFIADIDSGKAILFDRMTASNVEDLEAVMKRIASGIARVKPVSENAEVGMIGEEETKESLRRSSNKNIGVAFGYIYPKNGYNNSDRSFVFDVRLDYELEEAAAGILLGIRKGFAMNLYGSYLLTRTDVCPYVGGAFGFHWVSSHDDMISKYDYQTNTYRSQDKKSDGFELTFSGGLRLLHTYNFQIILNLDFIMTLNDFDDKALVFTIGIL